MYKDDMKFYQTDSNIMAVNPNPPAPLGSDLKGASLFVRFGFPISIINFREISNNSVRELFMSEWFRIIIIITSECGPFTAVAANAKH